jgi:LmbE family N-acetylglucosaminyl deacetylase
MMPSPVPGPRSVAAFVGRMALLATALLLVSLPATARADALCAQKRMAIVAHQDDDLIFENPSLLEEIAAGDCVRTVFVTAGDAGLGEAYWREREEGSRVAYATMAGVANVWTTSEPSIAGHTLHVETLVGKPTVSEVYLRLPNGGPTGAGYAATGYKSLPKLWRSHNPQPAELPPLSTLSALDGSATYTYDGLLATLEDLIEEFQPDILSTQDFTHEFGTGDHADHITTAKLTQIANGSYKSEHVLRSYMDYESENHPVNVFEPELAKKLNAYYAYAAHDSNEACASQTECEQPFYADYWAWLKRQIVLSETAVPGADAGPNRSTASGGAVTLDGSGSSDPLGHSLSYKWTQTAGPTVTLSNSHAVKPSFTAPTGPASLTFSLVVNSSEASSLADSVTVTVTAPSYALRVSRTGNGSGTVSSSPGGISCGADCEESYERGTVVTLSPTAAPGSEFAGWSGACTGTGACQVTMSALREVSAAFALQRHQLSVSKTGSGSGTVASSPAGISCGAACSASFDHGTVVTLSASPAGGSEFTGWSGACTGTGACQVTMSEARSLSAAFAAVPSYALKVAKTGNGSGTVSSSPGGISCGADCDHEFEYGTAVTLAGNSDPGTEPVAWSGCDAVNGSNECEVTMEAARNVTATFELEKHSLTLVKSGSGSGVVASSPGGIECGPDCVASFDHGAIVTLSASPAPGSEPVVWSGCDEVVGGDKCLIAMDGDKLVSATVDAASTPPTPTPVAPAPAASPASPTPPPSWTTPTTRLLKARVLRRRGTAHFVFAARGTVTKFHCALARIRRRLRFTPCTSPMTYRGLDTGTYIFKVKAMGPGGADATPVTRKFRVAISPWQLALRRSRSRSHLRAWVGPGEPLPRSQQ